MEQSYLVMSIVFNNEEAFKNLSKKDTLKMLLIAKMSQDNKSIIDARDKYATVHSAYDLFKKFDNVMISLAFAINSNDAGKIQAYQNVRQEILHTVYNDSWELEDCFFRLVIAEYKEYLYACMHSPCFDKMDNGVMSVYETFLNTEELNPVLWEHKHDPTHYLFCDSVKVYDFYDMIESKGGNILNEWTYGDAYDDVDFDEYFVQDDEDF